MKILIIGVGIFGVVSSLVLSEDTSHEVTLIKNTENKVDYHDIHSIL